LEQNFIGEHLLPGQLGHLFIIISFISALLSAFCYFSAIRRESLLSDPAASGWMRLARWSFFVHIISVIGSFSTLYYIISNHLFEYHYAWRHSSKGLQVKYLLSCFWEGSEGSFMLWLLWQAILGTIVIRSRGVLESRVMVITGIVQAILSTMLLGFFLGPDIKIGSNPFILLRHQMPGAPIFSSPDYLKFIEDGRGLNPLLQNYWMVIHPPVLFLGFALTLFPFAYSLAALWKNEYKSWIKPALRWSLACGAILGAGIMMGGAWAYESLNFGGYWAWDPVENASLVPWMTLIAALHTLVIYKSTGRSLKITLIFFVLTFVLIWYSTFLTRTGILGETSVHAFTDAGSALYWHLVIVLGLFLAGSIFLIVRSWRKMPKIAGEEEANSREFWMLIGSIFLLISGLWIIFYTSLPVWSPLWNKITGSQIAPPNDRVAFYNDSQVWFAFIIAVLSGAIQFFKYKKTGMRVVWKKLGMLSAISLVLSALLIWRQHIVHVQYMFFTFSIFFTITANLFYGFSVQKGNLRKAGGSLTHFGFGLMLLGILLSGYKKEIISIDRTGQVHDFGKETFEENAKESHENVLIFRNTTMPMGPYLVTYLGDSVVKNDPPITYYKVRYEKRNPETNELQESFVLYPDVFVNIAGQEGISPNPDAKHYLTHDVFTYITSISDPASKSDSSEFKSYTLKDGDSVYVANGYLVFEGLSQNKNNKNYEPHAGDIAAAATLSAYTIDGKAGTLSPMYIIRHDEAYSLTDTLRDLGLYARINKINPEEKSVEFGIRQRSQQDDYIVMKAMIFPYIGVLWTGIIVMVGGFIVSWAARRK